ncbi:hypothetical protein [Nitrolancea hollandica]|nr:hypothetical protein [Nitrolancea hollandica]
MEFAKQAFDAWLASKEPDAVVGYSTDMGGCPIYHWLTEGLGLTGVAVTTYSVHWAGEVDYHRQEVPWITRFITALDRSHDYQSHPVTAAEALAILRA